MSPLITADEQLDGSSSSIEYLRDASRAYRNQAVALIGICRFFSQFPTPGRGQSQDTASSQDAELTRVLKTCDDVLRFAAHSGHRSKHQTNDRFQSAIDTLRSYASTFHPGIDVVRARMGVARGRDTVSHAALRPPDLMVVNFVLFRTLPYPKPIVVSQILSHTAGFEEVLWIFAHFEDERRITLQDNPHFYSGLPTSLDAYTPQFKTFPADKSDLKPNATIYVLVSQRRRVFLETRHETRVFGSIFALKDAMIFKDIHGALEGDSVVAESIRGIPNLWRTEKFFVVPNSSTSAYDFSLWPIVTANPTANRTSQGPIDLIRSALCSGDNDLHIYAGKLPPLWTTREMVPPPSPPTSERPEYVPLYTSADAFNSNVLLTIFDHYRLDDEESWNLQLRWCKLSHVCQKWRDLIYRSSCRLDMHIPFTSCTCPFDIPTHLLPLPIVVDSRGSDVAGTDADIFHAIWQYDRIRHAVLKAPSPSMNKLIVPMNEPFPILESSSQSSTTAPEERTKLTIPTAFLPSILHHLTSHGACLSKEPPVIASSISLVTLNLTDIQAAEYFTPDDLVAQLQRIRHRQLEELFIDLSIPLPRPSDEGGLLREPSTLTGLPSLKQLEFRVGAHLESLLSVMNTPVLERFKVTLFMQLSFELPRLCHFTRTTEGLRHPVVNVVFNRDHGASFIVGAHRFDDRPFSLRVRCKHLGWKIAAATQVCNEPGPVLSVAEGVTLELDSHPPTWRDVVDGPASRELRRPFQGEKGLLINTIPVSGRCGIPESYQAGLTPWQRPVLRHLIPPVEIEHANASSTLIDTHTLFAHFIPFPVYSQHAHSTDSIVIVEKDVPLVSDPAPAKKNYQGHSPRIFRVDHLPTLTKFPFPSAPISERPGYPVLYTIADILNGDILLVIFQHYQLDNQSEWNRKRRWCKLSHVCRKWRHLIHQSSFHLNVHIYFINGTPPLNLLAHLPPFPLVVDYQGGDANDDCGVIHAIQCRDRILRIEYQAPCLHLGRLVVSMDESFPRLEFLSLSSTIKPEEGTRLTLPSTFLAPDLRHLSLHGICLPKGLPFLASAFSLITLKLTDIQSHGYFSPETLVTQLQHIPQLEELSIGFSTPLPRPSTEGELLGAPMTHTALPTLRRLAFRGVSVYVENLLARISFPLLERCNITLFNQLNFTLPHLSHFTRTTETLRHPVANVIFNQEGVSFVVTSRDELNDGTFSLRVNCKPFDWQIDSATQVCSALVHALSAAEELTLDFDEENLPSDWRNEVDALMWHALLWPFHGVKKLCVGYPLASELSNALESDDAELVLGLLPELEELEAQVELEHVNKAFETFIDARQLAGHHVRLSVSPVAISTTVPIPAEDELPVLLPSTPDEDEPPVSPPAPVKKNWFQRAVVEPVRRRLRSGSTRTGG